MKEPRVNCRQAVLAHRQATVVPQPADGAFDDPAPSVSPQGATILGRGPSPIPVMRGDQFDPARGQSPSQRIAVIAPVCDHPLGFLSRTARMMAPSCPDRGERRLREPDLRRGGSGKVVSQRNTCAVDHHHLLRAFPPAGFAHSIAPLLTGAKRLSRNDSLQLGCWRSFNSLKKARQMFSQTPCSSCSSPSRSRRQQVEGCGNSSSRLVLLPLVNGDRCDGVETGQLARIRASGRSGFSLQTETGSRLPGS